MGPSNTPPLEPDRLLTEERPTYQIPKRPLPPPYQPPRPSIGSMIRVLGGSVFVALLLVVALVQYYGRNERLATVEKVLIKPDTLENVNFTDIDPIQKRKNIFYFDNITFLPAGSEVTQAINLTTDQYDELYQTLLSDASVRIVTEDLETRFQDPLLVQVLTIYVKNNNRASGKSTDPIIFQTVQFLVGSPYFRVSMRQAGAQQWVYFKHAEQLDALLEKLKAK